MLFTDTSTGGVPTPWYWDFGDGIDSKHAQTATHTFTKPGNYTISLTAGNDTGNNKVMKPNYIVVTNPFPVADFSSNITHSYPPLSIQFTDFSQNATGWNWDFGDGSNSTQRSPVHEYADPGIYSVNLTATNENGTDSKLTTITVMQLVGVGPYAYITNSGDNNVSVIDTATNKVTATIHVGNGPIGVAITPDGSKVYVVNGNDDTVSVIDTSTNKVTATMNVGHRPSSFGQFIGSLQVHPILPVADFNSNVTKGYAPLTVQFNDISQKATSIIWDFDGDRQLDSNDINPAYIYANAGTYTVNLTASNENGTASKTTVINVLTTSSSSGGSSHSSPSGG